MTIDLHLHRIVALAEAMTAETSPGRAQHSPVCDDHWVLVFVRRCR